MICIPRPRLAGPIGWLRALWTAPTTLLGCGFARAAGCGPGESVGGGAVSARLYRLPPGRLQGLGAIALGHAIVVEDGFMGAQGPWLLAHELSHARQHDFLGPSYLLVHGLFQLVSVLCSLVRPRRGYPPQHAYNPLELGL